MSMKLIVAIMLVVLLGAGCTDAAASLQGARDGIVQATTTIQQKIADVMSAINAAREQWEKAQAILNILNGDGDDPASTDPASSDSATEGSVESTTPSVPPNEDLPPPATEDNISSP